MMRWVWLVVLVACSNSGPLAPAPQLKTATQMRVLSYNVNFGIAGDAPSIEAIANAKPDVVLLQETNEVWQRAILARLVTDFPHQHFTHPDSWPAGGMGLLS